MKKFLSILALACLLALGMALPAAAEGTELFAAFSEGDTPTTRLFLPKDMTRTIYFFKSPDGEPVTEGTFTKTGDEVDFSLVDGVYRITGLEVTEEGAPVKIVMDGSGLSPVEIKVVPSQFEVSVDGVKWQTSLTDLKVGDSVGVAFRLVAENKLLNIYDDVTESVTVTPASGLSFNNGKLSATTVGNYTLNYKGYSIPVKVSDSSATITKEELEHLKDSEKDFVSFLCDYKGYSGSGDFTLLLPAEKLGSVVCNTNLSKGATLTLKGTSDGTGNCTEMTGLEIGHDKISVDGIKFSGEDTAITLNFLPGNDSVCKVTNCEFGEKLKYVFAIKETSGNFPKVSLQGNTFLPASSDVIVKLMYSNDNEVGIWQVKPGTKTDNVVIDFSADITRCDEGVIKILFEDIKSVANNGWSFKFQTYCSSTPSHIYTVYEGKELINSKANDGTVQVTDPNKGSYNVIGGTYPTASNGKVTITAADAVGLSEVTVSTKFADATVTIGNQKALSAVNNGKLTFQLKGAGTYTITEIKTTTTTKTTTTSRSYKYTYQDYYQVTPAGFTNAMRYVKDNLVTLNCTEAGSRSISLPVASMAAAAEKGYSVLVKTKNAELTLDAAALKSIAQQAKGTTVLLHYKSLNHKTLTTVGQASIQSHLAQFPGDNADLAFLVTATSDSETIEDLQMGTITLRIPFILLPGTEGMANTVYALQSESIAEARETTVAEGHLTTKLLDLTEHMVFLSGEAAQPTEETTEPAEETTEPTEETEPTQPETVPETTQPAQPAQAEKKGGSPILTMVIVLGVVLVIGGGALGFLLLRRRFRK